MSTSAAAGFDTGVTDVREADIYLVTGRTAPDEGSPRPTPAETPRPTGAKTPRPTPAKTLSPTKPNTGRPTGPCTDRADFC